MRDEIKGVEQSEATVQIAGAQNSPIYIQVHSEQKPKKRKGCIVMHTLITFLIQSILFVIGAGAFFYGIINMIDSIHIRIVAGQLREFQFILDTDINLVIAAMGLILMLWSLAFKRYLREKEQRKESHESEIQKD